MVILVFIRYHLLLKCKSLDNVIVSIVFYFSISDALGEQKMVVPYFGKKNSKLLKIFLQ